MRLNKKKKKIKADKIAVISIVIFGILGVSAFIVGYGLKDGWEAVLKWFISRWAVYCYIALALFIFIIIYVIHRKRMED